MASAVMTTTGVIAPVRSRLSTALIVASLCLCGTVVSLQQTLVVPILPELPRLLSTSSDNASWLVTATLLAGAVSTPVVSRLADMFGKRKMIVLCLLFSIGGSFIGAFSTSLLTVVAGRTLQGVGMALIPVGIAIMRDELPKERVPLGVALMSATLAVGAGAGLPLAGIIASSTDWHAIFWVTAGAGILMLVFVLLVLPESPVRSPGHFDYRGAAGLTIALTALLLAISKGGVWGWGNPWTLGLGFGGLLVLIAWVPLELRVRRPLVDIRVARRPAVLLVNISSVLVGFAMFGNMLVTTQLLQLPTSTGYGLGLGMVESGLWLAPTALVFGALAPVSAAITRRFGAHTTLMSGALIMSVFYVARVFLSNDLTQIVIGAMLVSVGTSLTYAAMPTLIMRAVPVTETASANGLNTLLRSVGTSMSSAAVGVALSVGTVLIAGESHPALSSFQLIFWGSALTCLVSAVLALPLRRLTADSEYDEDERAMDDAVPTTDVAARGGIG